MQSSKLKAALWILGGVIVLLLVFGAGAAVGYRRAAFVGRVGDHYYGIFYGGPIGSAAFNTHGVAGQVIDIGSSTVSVRDFDGDEHSVTVSSDTVIREGDATIMIGGMQVGDTITVIGAPNGGGQVAARFIRVFGASSSVPIPPPLPGMNFN